MLYRERQTKINSDKKLLDNWLRMNSLRLSTKKTHYMVLGNKNKPQIELNIETTTQITHTEYVRQ